MCVELIAAYVAKREDSKLGWGYFISSHAGEGEAREEE